MIRFVLGAVPKTHTKVMVDIASPAAAVEWWRLPADEVVKIHPIALVHPERVTDSDALRQTDIGISLGSSRSSKPVT